MTHPVATRTPIARSLPRAVALLCALFSAASFGCRSSNQELVEIELRSKEEQLEKLKQEVDRRDLDARALEMEIAQLQRACTKPGQPAGNVIVVKEITLGRLTGGVDEDPKLPGDEALQILLEPRDADNNTVKAPGSLHVDAYEIMPQGQKVFLSSWDLSPGELRKKWDEPLLGSAAYRIVLPWKTQPASEKLRIVVRFKTLDGQEYEVDKDVAVRLPDLPRRRYPMPDSSPMPSPPQGPCDKIQPHPCTLGDETLDAPRPLLSRPGEIAPTNPEPASPPPPEPPKASGSLTVPLPPPPITPTSCPGPMPPKLAPPTGARPAPPAVPS